MWVKLPPNYYPPYSTKSFILWLHFALIAMIRIIHFLGNLLGFE